MFNYDVDKARENFNTKFAQPAYQKFQEQVVPGITGQFRGGNLQNSSYLGGALSKAGTDVQRNLDAQLADMLYQGQNASVERRINGINNLLGMQTFAYEQPQASAADKAFGALNEYGGKAAANYLDNKFNTAPGNSATPSVNSAAPLPGMGNSSPYLNTIKDFK